MRMTIRYDPETNLIELESSNGELSITQSEAGALYILLKKALGFKGRLKLLMSRGMYTQI